MTMTIIPSTAPDSPETTPRSLEVLVPHVRAEALCPWCQSLPGVSCIWQGRRGVHMGRIVRAFVRGKITVDELAIVVKPYDANFTGKTIVRTGAR